MVIVIVVVVVFSVLLLYSNSIALAIFAELIGSNDFGFYHGVTIWMLWGSIIVPVMTNMITVIAFCIVDLINVIFCYISVPPPLQLNPLIITLIRTTLLPHHVLQLFQLSQIFACLFSTFFLSPCWLFHKKDGEWTITWRRNSATPQLGSKEERLWGPIMIEKQ